MCIEYKCAFHCRALQLRNFAAPEMGVPLPLQERASQINSHVTIPCLLDIVNLAFKVPAAIT